MKQILLSLRGDPTDQDALEVASRIAKATKAKVFGVYVIEVKPALPLDANLPSELDRADAVVREAEDWARKNGMDLETEILQVRDPGPALADEASERKIDLIIIGLPFKTRFGEFDLGRTVTFLLRKAPCRVWVLRGPEMTQARQGERAVG